MRIFSVFCLSIMFIFSSCDPDDSLKTELHSGVPKSAFAILEINNLQKLITDVSETQIYKDADSLSALLNLKSYLSQIETAFSQDTLNFFLKERKAITSLSLSGAGKYNALFLTLANNKLSTSLISQLSNKYPVVRRNYANVDIYSYSKGNNPLFSIAYHKGLILFSANKTLIEEGIRQLNSEYDIRKEADFDRLRQTANDKDLLNLYVRLDEFPNWVKSWLPQSQAKFLSRLGKWGELDLKLYNRELLLSGLFLTSETSPYLINTFSKIDAEKTLAQQKIPQSTGLWISYTFNNVEHYHRNYLQYLELKGTLKKHQQLLQGLNISQLDEKLLHWVDTEMGLIYTGVSPESANKIAYFKINSKEKAEAGLEALSDSSYIQGYRGEILKRIDFQNLLPRFYGSLFSDFNNPYYFVSDDFVWFSESESVLKGFINDLISGKSLSKNPSYQNLSEKIPARSHIKVIASNPAFLDLAKTNFNMSEAREIDKFQETLGNYRWAALQLEIRKDVAFTNFLMINEPKVEEEVSRQWNTVLDAPAATTPQFVLNHNNRKYEILIQDKNHNLYLIDRKGKILWKTQLDGLIMGKACQVDLYKNNKLQLAFNTEKSFYILDRLGRNVENFPISFKEKITAPVGVFNYDRARNYRFLIPMGKQLLNYGKDAKKVRGWSFKKADSKLISQPQLFTIDGKDIIVCLSEFGSLYILNRKGDERIKKFTELENLKPPFYVRKGSNLKSSELVINNEDGELVVLNLEGLTDEIYLDEDYPANHFLYFDGKYILTNENRLMVKDEGLPWFADLESEITTIPKAMIYDGNFYAGAWCKNSEEIYLFNKKGEKVKGFPVFGQSAFDMGSLRQDGVINIVTTTTDGTVICYEVN